MSTPNSSIAAARAISRRHFLAQTGSAVALAATLPTLAPAAEAKTALYGSNVYGWTQYYARDKKPFNLDEVIAALADAGYDYLENNLDGNPDNNLKFAEKLKARGMRPVSLYTGAALHDAAKAGKTVEALLKNCRACKDAGFAVISCNADPIGRAKTDEELKTQAAALADLGKGLNEIGLKLGLHHHLPEMQNQAREFHYTFRHTPPEAVGFCYDVHWVFKGGVPPAEALPRYGDRVVTWHLRQGRDGIWWEDLDTGDVDYPAVAKYALEHHLPRRFTVELALEGKIQITRSAVENHRRSLAYAKKVFGA